MKISMILLADYASVDSLTGKLNILGVFRNIEAHSFPAVHPRMSVVVLIEGAVGGGQSEHTFGLDVADEDGGSILNLESAFSMPQGDPGLPPVCNLILEVNGLEIPKPGHYRFSLAIDEGEVQASIEVQVGSSGT